MAKGTPKYRLTAYGRAPETRARPKDYLARLKRHQPKPMRAAWTGTMDAAGRLVIPREIRREAALEPGVPLEVRWRDGVIEIEPKPLDVTMRRRGRLLVASPRNKVEALRAAAVERTRAHLAEPRTRR